MSNQALIEFNIRLDQLSKNEREVLKLLKEAARLIAPLYQKQEKQAQQLRISQQELEKAAQLDPELLSPYTVIYKKNGQIIAVPYQIEYKDYLKPIADKLLKAAQVTENRDFKKVLQIKAQALLDGDYEKSIKTELSVKQFKIDILIEPIQHLDDKLFYGKASYQAWVGIIDQEGTERLNNYKAIILSSRSKNLMPSERVENKDHVRAKVLDVVILSGLMAHTKFVGVNLPMDPNLVEKYGSEVTLFNQPNGLRVREQILPTFSKIFPKEFREEYSEEDLSRGYMRTVAMHELSHSYLFYRHAAEHLQEYFQSIYELAATVLGIRMAGALLLIDRISSKQLESMILASISRNYYLKLDKSNKSMVNYALSGAILINFLCESGALKESGKLLIPNFMKIFVSLQDLLSILERLLSSGTRKDAESFIKKYGNIK